MRFSITCELWSSKPNSRFGFSLPSIKMMVTANEPWNTEKTKKQNGSKSTNHDRQTRPFDPAEVSFCFSRGPLRWLTAAKNVNRWLRFEFQNSHDIENPNYLSIPSILLCSLDTVLQCSVPLLLDSGYFVKNLNQYLFSVIECCRKINCFKYQVLPHRP